MKWFQKSTGLVFWFVVLMAGVSAGEEDTSNTVPEGNETSEQAKTEEKAPELTKKGEDDPEQPEKRQVLGWKEWIKIGSKADLMRAKLDSGARTSSLHAENIEEFERDGQKWVRFSLCDPGRTDAKSILFKAPLERVARVKNTDGTVERRFVIELGFSLGDLNLREEFTLNDRTGLTCPVLIGRNALRHLGYVDCSRVDLVSKKLQQ